MTTARATVTAGRIFKSISELKRCDWDVIAKIVDEVVTEVEAAERRRILAIIDEEATHYSVAPMNPASPREIVLVFANAVKAKSSEGKLTE